ncbi:MAG TPA: DUF2177 family protein [Nocardioidaceae bacterium]|nr:DUF2177 family protein [Nocardioidaceae bacterium]
MSIKDSVGQYLIAAAVFSLLDLVWLGLIAKELYRDLLGDLVAENTNVPAAVLFYAIFIGGLVYFVIGPAIADGSWTKAVIGGAVYGLVTYATWDLTNLSVIEDFPATIVPIDMAWGTVLAASVSVTTYHLWHRVTSRATH